MRRCPNRGKCARLRHICDGHAGSVAKRITLVTIVVSAAIELASSSRILSVMTILSRFRFGRILLHLLAMLGDRSVRFHVAGISRELPWSRQH